MLMILKITKKTLFRGVGQTPKQKRLVLLHYNLPLPLLLLETPTTGSKEVSRAQKELRTLKFAKPRFFWRNLENFFFQNE